MPENCPQTDGQTDRQADRQTGEWMDGQTDRQTDRWTDRQTDGRTQTDRKTERPMNERNNKGAYQHHVCVVIIQVRLHIFAIQIFHTPITNDGLKVHCKKTLSNSAGTILNKNH